MTDPYRRTKADEAPIAFPAPPPPEGGYGCPRCKSPHTTLAEVEPRFLLLALLNQTRCNSCGFAFNGKTGKSTAPVVALVFGGPILLVIVVVLLLVYFAASH